MGRKTMPLDRLPERLRSGMTLGIGGWGSRRKPMALVRELLRSDITDLTVVTFGGPDVGLLCAAGRVRRLIYGFVSLDSIPLDPHFRAAREAGRIETNEYDEGMFVAALRAGANRLSFMPTRAGMASDVLRMNPGLKTIRSPYDDDEYVAVPGIRLDAALIHVNRADEVGNGQYLGPDPYFDDLLAMAADETYMSAERIVPTAELTTGATHHTLLISRLFTTGVVETPNGAHFTGCEPDYPRDEAFQKHYVQAAADEQAWAGFSDTYLSGDEAAYQAAVAAFRDAPTGATTPGGRA
ncbi:CoA transferase subunit A [Tsukamurella soli]|uniref:CoA transferase subunit A n=1 Tax=Tsukamurella soli TaxID=644556 RepID=A0ABP8JPL9_9ACTN